MDKGSSHFHHAEHLIASAYALMGDAQEPLNGCKKQQIMECPVIRYLKMIQI